MIQISKSNFGVFALGFVWAAEMVLGKLFIQAKGLPTDFPILLNLGTIVIVGLYGLIRREWGIFSLVKSKILPIIATALTLIFIPYLVIYLALDKITPAEVALISSLTPLCTVGISSMVDRKLPRPRALIAVAMGFAGVTVLVSRNEAGGVSAGHLMWSVLMLVVPVSYALSGYAMKYTVKEKVGYLQLTFFVNVVSLLMFAVLNNVDFGLLLVNKRANLYAAAGVFFNVTAAVTLLALARNVSPVKLSFSNYSTIFWSAIMSVVLFSQPLGLLFFMAVALIAASAYVINVTNI